MKTNVKKAVAVLSAATILMGMPCVYAKGGDNTISGTDNGIVMPRYTAIKSYTEDLSISSTGVLSCYGKTTVYSPYVAYVKVELKKNGTTVKTWTNRQDTSASVDNTYNASRGNTYILRVTHSSYDSSGNLIESVVSYSDEIIYN